MLRALTSGVSGLKSHQTKMDVIGNNIANVNTYGFKASRVSFKDAYYQTLTDSANATDVMGGGNPAQIGYGSMVSTIDVLHNRGGYTATGNPMDVFIGGEGYLVVRDGSGAERYTRTGILNFDGEGNLVDGNKQYIYGYPIGRYRENVNAKASTLDVGGGASALNFGDVNGEYFNGYKLVVKTGTGAADTIEADNKAKTFTVTLKNGATDITAADLQTLMRTAPLAAGSPAYPQGIDLTKITVTGANIGVGKTHAAAGGDKAHVVGDIMFETMPSKSAVLKVNNLTVDFGTTNGSYFNGFKIKTAKRTDGVAATDAEIDITEKTITIQSDQDPIPVADLQAALQAMTVKAGQTMPADIDPTLITIGGTDASLAAGTTTIKAYDGKNVSQQTILDKTHGLQQISKPGSLIDTDKNGSYDTELNDVMSLVGIHIGGDGTITGEDGNGNIIQLGQIVLANIPNPQALNMSGDSYLSAVNNAGEITYSIPGENGVGQLVSSGLEGSNVDLANEFAEMITTQRGFQANSRIITVGDEMLQELINLKR